MNRRRFCILASCPRVKVVFDAGVVFSGAGWRGEAHRCLLAMAHRRVIAYATVETLKELICLLQFPLTHSSQNRSRISFAQTPFNWSVLV
jgi:hypothetical protein